MRAARQRIKWQWRQSRVSSALVVRAGIDVHIPSIALGDGLDGVPTSIDDTVQSELRKLQELLAQ